MSASLSILHLGSEVHPGGSTVSIALLARAQQAAGHTVAVGCRAGSGLERAARAAGVETVAVDWDAGSRAAARELAALAAVRVADVVNSHSSPDRAACRRARLAGWLRPALVMTRRAMPRSSWPSALWSGLAADRVIAVSRGVARALARRGTPRRRIAVVPNAVDLARIERAPSLDALARATELSGASVSRPTIGMVARRKNQELLLAAVLRLRRPVTVCLLGISPDERLQPHISAALQLGHEVRCVPFEADVAPFYGVFDLAVLPSTAEGCSQALLEAMAAGVPVVAGRNAGNAELVEDGVTGLLAAPTPAALAEALDRQLADRAARERMAAAAKQRVRERFTIERTLAGTMAVYASALALRGERAGMALA